LVRREPSEAILELGAKAKLRRFAHLPLGEEAGAKVRGPNFPQLVVPCSR
jgi:hypothetical protein